MTEATNRLFVRRLLSIGAVESGDNEGATIALFKRRKSDPIVGKVTPKTSEPLEGRKHGGGSMAESAVDLSSLDDDTKAAIESQATEFEATIAKLETQVSELKAEVKGDDEEEILPDDLPEAVAKRFADQEERVAKAEATAAAAEAKVEKAEDARLTEMYAERAVALRPVLGDPEKMAPVLKALAAGAPAAYPVLDAQLDTLVNMDGFEKLLREHGDNSATGRAVDQIAVYAKEIRKDNKELSLVAAKAQAWQEHPELKTQAREEGD